MIILDNLDGTYSAYGHLRKNGSTVNVGDYVEEGDQIGNSGNTGFSRTPHLHWEPKYKPFEGINPVEAYLSDKRVSVEVRFDEEITKALIQIAEKKI